MLHTTVFYSEALMLIPEFSYPSHPKTEKQEKAIKEMLANTSFCFKKPEMLYNSNNNNQILISLGEVEPGVLYKATKNNTIFFICQIQPLS